VMLNISMKEDVICVEGNVVRSGNKLGKVYSFLVDGMLVDTGPQCLEADYIPFYDGHSYEFAALTHSHEDHSGTAPWLQENKNVPIYVHPKGVSICEQDCPYPKYRQITWGVRRKFQALPLGETIQSRNQAWKVIYTPGHAEDHVSLLNEETGRLVSGDLFVAPKTKVIMDSESIPVIMDSIRKLLTYEFESMFCCHAGYIPNGKEMLKQKLDNLVNLCGEVEDLYKKGFSIPEINQTLFPKKYPIIAFSEGEWDSLHIVSSIVSHLEKT
jgi:ribonuclease/clavin/mitogillin